ncbi:anti-sigma factor family protein [Microvirga sp. G4-2]|uniref:anti-sigma factor family protein n=1 Tax=Microvirga sp. G4-2 TaxID=3434467 RepID=UPI004044B1FC
MAQLHFSDEILMAFADGELDEQVAAMVEQAMASDLAVAKRVAEFLRSRHLIRSAFPSETASDVPPELQAAVQAQIDRFERHATQQTSPGEREAPQSAPSAGRQHLGMALAASLAAFAIATGGYLAGRQGLLPSSSDPIANLAAPDVSRTLSESPSGQDKDLPFGRMRVISTFRMANGSVCREFKLQMPHGTSHAVACRGREWVITFAIASAATNELYVPSGGADLMASYLQNAGAGEPLLGSAEMKALSEARRQR